MPSPFPSRTLHRRIALIEHCQVGDAIAVGVDHDNRIGSGPRTEGDGGLKAAVPIADHNTDLSGGRYREVWFPIFIEIVYRDSRGDPGDGITAAQVEGSVSTSGQDTDTASGVHDGEVGFPITVEVSSYDRLGRSTGLVGYGWLAPPAAAAFTVCDMLVTFPA